MRRLLPLLAWILVATSCDLAEEDYRPQMVVEGLLAAGEPLTEVRLSQSAPIGVRYSFEAFAVSGAVVEVALLDGAGADAERYVYAESTERPGVYLPAAVAVVLPLRRYRLTVRPPSGSLLVPEGRVIRAETLVPDTFRVVVPPPDTVRYDIFSRSPELRVTRSAYPGRQAVYVFSIEALEPLTFGLTPTFAAFVDPEDALEFAQGTSPLLNEQNYATNPDGTLTLSIPWLAVRFYGPNRFTATALDDALYDYVRSRNAQFGATTLSPGEIPEVLSNVENGVGVFGSAAREAVEVFISPR
jgi:hypothetical protein